MFFVDKQDELRRKLKELANGESPAPPTKKSANNQPKKKQKDTPPPPPPKKSNDSMQRPGPLAQRPKTPRPRRQIPRWGEAPIQGQLKQTYQPDVKNMVNSFIENNDKGFKSNLNNFLSTNSTFKATQLTACNTNNPTLDDIICNLKFQYKIQSFI